MYLNQKMATNNAMYNLRLKAHIDGVVMFQWYRAKLLWNTTRSCFLPWRALMWVCDWSSSFSSPNKPQTRRAASIKSPHSRHLCLLPLKGQRVMSESDWAEMSSDSAHSEHHWYHYASETDESVLTDWLVALEVNYDRCRGARDNLDILWSTNDPGQAGMEGHLTPRLLQSSWKQQDGTSLAAAELFLT